MKKTAELFFELVRNNQAELSTRFGVRRLGIFGSCVRGEEGEASDIDILVEFDRKTFDNYMELKFYLEMHLKRNVDLVIADALKPALRDGILKEVRYAA